MVSVEDGKSISIGRLEHNAPLNRFKNIIPCKLLESSVNQESVAQYYTFFSDDDYSITLIPFKGVAEFQNSYINASYIDVSTIALSLHTNIYYALYMCTTVFPTCM